MKAVDEGVVKRAFDDGSVFYADDKTLDSYLMHLSSQRVDNQSIRHTYIVRANIINTIKTDRYIRKADKQNLFHTWVIIILAIVSMWYAKDARDNAIEASAETSRQMKELIQIENERILIEKKAKGAKK